jgi:hypothetical protein
VEHGLRWEYVNERAIFWTTAYYKGRAKPEMEEFDARTELFRTRVWLGIAANKGCGAGAAKESAQSSGAVGAPTGKGAWANGPPKAPPVPPPPKDKGGEEAKPDKALKPAVDSGKAAVPPRPPVVKDGRPAKPDQAAVPAAPATTRWFPEYGPHLEGVTETVWRKSAEPARPKKSVPRNNNHLVRRALFQEMLAAKGERDGYAEAAREAALVIGGSGDQAPSADEPDVKPAVVELCNPPLDLSSLLAYAPKIASRTLFLGMSVPTGVEGDSAYADEAFTSCEAFEPTIVVDCLGNLAGVYSDVVVKGFAIAAYSFDEYQAMMLRSRGFHLFVPADMAMCFYKHKMYIRRGTAELVCCIPFDILEPGCALVGRGFVTWSVHKLTEKHAYGEGVLYSFQFADGLPAVSDRVVTTDTPSKSTTGLFQLDPSTLFSHEDLRDGEILPAAIELPLEWASAGIAAAMFSARGEATFQSVRRVVIARGQALVKVGIITDALFTEYLPYVMLYAYTRGLETEMRVNKLLGWNWRTFDRYNRSLRLRFDSAFTPWLRFLKRWGIVTAVVVVVAGTGLLLGCPLPGLSSALLAGVAVVYKTRPHDKLALPPVLNTVPLEPPVTENSFVVNREEFTEPFEIAHRAGLVAGEVCPVFHANDVATFYSAYTKRVFSAGPGTTAPCARAFAAFRRDNCSRALSPEELDTLRDRCPELFGSTGGLQARSFAWWLENQCRPDRRAVLLNAYRSVQDRFGFEAGLSPPKVLPATWQEYSCFVKLEPGIPKEDGAHLNKPRIVVSGSPEKLVTSVGIVSTLSSVMRAKHGTRPLIPGDCPWSNEVYGPGLVPAEMSEWSNGAIQYLKHTEAADIPRLWFNRDLADSVGLPNFWLRVRARFESYYDAAERLPPGEALRAAFGPNALDVVFFGDDATGWEYGYDQWTMLARQGGPDPTSVKAPRFEHGLSTLLKQFDVTSCHEVEWFLKSQEIIGGTLAGIKKMRGLRGKDAYAAFYAEDRKRVASGESTTTLMNCEDHLDLIMLILSILGKGISDHVFRVVCGDDGASFTFRFIAELMADGFSEHPFGFDYGKGKGVKIVDLDEVNCWEADFCSMRLWPVGDRFEWGPMPERILLRTFHMKVAPRDVAERICYAAEVATGLLDYCRCVPFVWDLIEALASIDRRVLTKHRYMAIKPKADVGGVKMSRGATAQSVENTVVLFVARYPELAKHLQALKGCNFKPMLTAVACDGFYTWPPQVVGELLRIGYDL